MAPAATAARMANVTRGKRALLVMHGPALKACRHDCEQQIQTGETPQATPVAAHFVKSCTRLVEADEAVDRKLGGKDRSGGEHGLRYRLARPRKSHQEQQWNSKCNEQKHRRLGVPESGAYGL